MSENTPSAEAFGDDVYQPAGSDSANRPSGPYDPGNALDTDPTEDLAEPGYSPPERPRGVARHGTTAREQRERASLDDRLAEERPDDPGDAWLGDGMGDLPGGEGEPLDEESGARRAGRLAWRSDDGVSAVDVGTDDGTAPAEEAAMHRDTGIDGA
ncbi:DUF5709 domain-containing protein [Streptomyces sp. NPDC048717]|uniref:DUF5709 domain-containing protein n=1 Tax=Streptomyces sp. NPDC048717 TaxID=3154928 RepID=UPI003421F54E